MHVEVSCPVCHQDFGVNVHPDRASVILRTRLLICQTCFERSQLNAVPGRPRARKPPAQKPLDESEL